MKVRLLLVVFVIHWGNNISSKIDISRCLTPYGFEGSCRLPEECVSVREFDASNCPHGVICCPSSGRISEEMCHHYAKLVYSTGSAVNLMAHMPQLQNTDQCAIIAVPLIVGGEEVHPREFPHQAVLGYGEELRDLQTSWECGGSLISELFVLTAAHCVLPNRRPSWVKLGITNLINDLNNQQNYRIREYILHPNYDPNRKLNDMALLRLAREVIFTAYVRPACLDFSGVISENRAIATGFGITRHAGEQSLDLLKVQLDILNKDDCKRLLRSDLHQNQICAGVLTGGQDTCRGDSGGPLQTIKQNPYCMYNIIGVTSYGSVCGYSHSPAIYTRVWSFIPWIEATVWPKE